MDYKSLCINCFAEKGAKNLCPVCGYAETGADQTEATIYLPPRTILAGKYLTGKVLGQGGFGITYLGWDLNLGVKLAIKEFFPQGLVSRLPGQSRVVSLAGTEAQQFDYWLERFLKEARTLARFEHHPNIVSVRDFFKEHNTAYMVMSYVEGLTLEQYLVREGGRLSFERAGAIMMPVLDALREIHEVGFMHRDISPDNIFIDKRGRVVLIDFGAARQELREKSKSLSVILKAGYAPEEQYRSKGKQGPWTDIYAAGATLYRCLTGQVPPEAMDRLAEDELIPPSKLGIEIEPQREAALLKALAIRAKDRYQAVDDFQAELVAASDKDRPGESYDGVRTKKTGEPVKENIEDSEESIKEKVKEGFQTEAVKATGKKAEPAAEPAGRVPQEAPAYSVSKRTVKTAALVLLCGLFIFGAVGLFGGVDDAADPALADPVDLNDEDGVHEAEQTFDPAIIAGLDADYYIDYENGTIPLGDLPIGARVVDPSWEWEFRTGNDYTLEAGDETKPVIWIIVAKDHYDGLEPHVTLLSEELIGRHVFDNSSHVDDRGYNHWGESGNHSSADRGLRPWLNSTGIHSGEGFYRVFSEGFKQAVLTTTLPNKEWQNGSAYSTQDKVFLPSTTKLGDTEHRRTYQIGTAYPYFQGADSAKRVALLGGEAWLYWTRSPASSGGGSVRCVRGAGECYGYGASYGHYGVRPALNLKSETLVSEIRN